jgi:hypothetical protein
MFGWLAENLLFVEENQLHCCFDDAFLAIRASRLM